MSVSGPRIGVCRSIQTLGLCSHSLTWQVLRFLTIYCCQSKPCIFKPEYPLVFVCWCKTCANEKVLSALWNWPAIMYNRGHLVWLIEKSDTPVCLHLHMGHRGHLVLWKSNRHLHVCSYIRAIEVTCFSAARVIIFWVFTCSKMALVFILLWLQQHVPFTDRALWMGCCCIGAIGERWFCNWVCWWR